MVDILTYDDLLVVQFSSDAARSLYPRGFKIGNSLGRPNMRELQKKVLRDALSLLTQNTRPGEVVTIEYPEYGEQYEPARVKKLG